MRSRNRSVLRLGHDPPIHQGEVDACGLAGPRKDLWISGTLDRLMGQNVRVRVDRQMTRRVRLRRGAARRAGIALLGVGLIGVTACTPEPGPTPTPSPTFSCSVNVGECTPQQAAKESKAAKDHGAAKAALQGGVTEVYRILGEGGVVENTKQLERYVAEDDLDSALKAIQDFEKTKRLGQGTVTVANVSFETKYPNASQQVLVCEDATKFYTTDRAGKNRTPPGFRLKYTATLKLMDGQWKRTQSTESVKVDSCDV